MKISIVGTGYVGLVTASCLADLGHSVLCIDVIPEKVAAVNECRSPIYEPGLDELLRKARDAERLRASTDMAGIASTDITFVCVGTPSRKDGSLDLKFIKSAVRDVAVALKNKGEYHLVIVKSTVMPRTTQDVVAPILEKASGKRVGPQLGLAMNPEFLKEGMAVHDAMHPDRIIIGAYDERSARVLGDLYSNFDCEKMVVPLATAEMIKVASNAFLATKISFVNEVGNVCKSMGIDFRQVAQGMGYDQRIGKQFLRAGCGYGGSCFPKDLKGLIAESKRYEADMMLLKAVKKVNDRQPYRLLKLLEDHIDVPGRTIAVLGLAFKPETDDVREASSIKVVSGLLAKKAKVKAYDPKAMDNFAKLFPDVTYCRSASECVAGADAVLIVTEWKEFSDPALYGQTLVVDGRGLVKTDNYEGICW